MHSHRLNPRFTIALGIATTIAVFAAVSTLSGSSWRSLAYPQAFSVGSSSNQSLSPTGSSNTSLTIPHETSKGASSSDANIIQSPFRNTFAYVRFNHDLPEREKVVLEGYNPFFHTVHVSMPSEGHNTTELNRTRDFSDDAFVPYAPVADLLKIILDDPELSHVDGLLFFHFDAWVEPMSFFDMDFDKFWVLNKGEMLPFQCMGPTPYRNPDWMWFQHDGVKQILTANRLAANLMPEYNINADRFCTGWSDLYFVPRRYFADFIALSSVYALVPLFHEIAVPTIFNHLDHALSPHPSLSVLSMWGDCFGGCCKEPAFVDEILEHRCGHKLDYRDWDIAKTHYDRLRASKSLLGKHWPAGNVRRNMAFWA